MKKVFNNQILVVDRYLAKILGLNEAIVLQQINYWLEINKKKNNNFHDGKYWTYNTIEDWQKQFPFWSKETVKRIFSKLRKMDILITANYNRMKLDRTLWYSIDYEELEKQLREAGYPFDDNDDSNSEDSNNGLDNSEQMQQDSLTSPLPKISSEITKKNINQSISPSRENNINKRQIDRLKVSTPFNEKYEKIISNCYIDSLDETYRDAAAHTIKLLLLDIEKGDRVKIGENYIPSSIVEKDIGKLDHFIVEHAINKFKKISRTTRIINTIAYLKTCIYNSISEMKIEIEARLGYEGII